MMRKEILAARNVLCKKMRQNSMPCAKCPLEKIRDKGATCRDSVLKHKAEAEENLKKQNSALHYKGRPPRRSFL